MKNFRKKTRSVRRLRQILHVLAKYGFGYLTGRLNIRLNKLSKYRSGRKGYVKEMSAPERLRRVLEELGPAFVKLGQMLSTRPDIVSEAYCRELEKLQDNVAPCQYGEIAARIKEELGKGPSSIFKEFSRRPAAAASLAQVHAARLATGEEVVVKVLRPGIEDVISADLELLHFLARLAEKYIEESVFYNPVGVVSEFKRVVRNELDFEVEARNIERFRRNFKDDDTVRFPEIYREYSSTRVLTMERMRGIKVSEIEKIEDSGLDRARIAVNGARVVLKQIFQDGFFHADPHPGNIFVLPENRIAFLDFGQVGRLHRTTRTRVASMLVSVFEHDPEEVAETFVSAGMVPGNSHKFELDLEDLISRYYGIPLGELKIGEFLTDLMSVIMENKISVLPELFVLTKALVMIESIGCELDPGFDMTAEVKPFIEKIIREKYDPKLIAKDFRKFSSSGMSLAKTLPKDVSEILSRIKSGTARLEFEHQGLEDFILHMDKVSNRISFSLIIAALVIGSALIMMTDKGPILLEFPVLGILGFVAAGIMGLWLVVAILRSGKL